MPDHLYCIWTLPPEDTDNSMRWGLLKARFSHALPAGERISQSRVWNLIVPTLPAWERDLPAPAVIERRASKNWLPRRSVGAIKGSVFPCIIRWRANLAKPGEAQRASQVGRARLFAPDIRIVGQR